jgi:hypothetical protein
MRRLLWLVALASGGSLPSRIGLSRVLRGGQQEEESGDLGRIVTSRRGFYPTVIEALDGTLREPPPSPTHPLPLAFC